jgi:hypothetical protein
MTATELPDGLYIRWKGRTRRAYETSDPPETVLVNLDPGEQAPARYERDDGVEDWIYVPERELEELFQLRTYALWQGMRCPVDRRIGPDRILLSTPLIGAERAAALGLTPTLERGIYAAEVPVTDVTELVQERTEIALD